VENFGSLGRPALLSYFAKKSNKCYYTSIKLRFFLKRNLDPEASPGEGLKDRKRRAIAAAVIALALAGGSFYLAAHKGGGQNTATAPSGQVKNVAYDSFLTQTGNSLINLHQPSTGGWRFRSEIQAPHYQTDRDVGAASAGMGFLAEANAYPKDEQWINAAQKTADWLIAVSSQDGNGGRYWHDYVDDNGTSPNVYTSFDDGSIGIGDFFWQLYDKTGDDKYKNIALQTLQWTFSQAEPYNQDGLLAYRWKWDAADNSSPYYMGMGEGTVGIVDTLATYYQRLQHSDPQIASECKKYMQGGLNYIEIVRQNLANNTGSGRALPETGVIGQDGDTALNSGYLSGTAGAAFMYLKVHQVLGDKSSLNEAEKLLDWLSDSKQGPLVNVSNDQAAWRLELDPQGGNDNQYATGVEEGAAGIGWTFLQAYGQTGKQVYLDMAEKAGNWLLGAAKNDGNGGLYWHEDEHPASQSAPHVNLNNGAAGIGMFFIDLNKATSNEKYQKAAQGALKGIMNSAQHNGSDIFWKDKSGNTFQADPSWHWGDAGIIEFLQRMNGGGQDILGEQPAIPSKLLNKH
jgi:rhamnogalacturonyl hydrolase YesR